MRNKKGFTLVELLAVIVILALIMSIAVVSIGGVLQSTRQNAFKETAASIINGVRQQLLVYNELKEGYYTFSETIVEKGGEESPLGGKINYTSTTNNRIGQSAVYRATGTLTCGAGSTSYVHVVYNPTTFKYTYSICLTAGAAADKEYYIKETEEADLLNNSKADMFVKPA